MNGNAIPVMLGVKETAQTFGIAEYHARQLALQGKVKAVRVGKNKILINQQSVADYFNNTYVNKPLEQEHIGIQPIPAKL